MICTVEAGSGVMIYTPSPIKRRHAKFVKVRIQRQTEREKDIQTESHIVTDSKENPKFIFYFSK
jgi:hypothetical protein